jgi:predicted peroxiredoxin
MTPSSERRSLVVTITAGEEAPERCSQGFTVAAAATSAGADVSLWLAGESVWLVTPGRAAAFDLPHTAPLDGLLDLLLGAATVTVSTTSAARRGLGDGDFVPGVRIGGAAAYVEEVLRPDTKAVSF